MSEIILNDDNFNEIVSKNKKLLIDFWAPWCGPCRMIAGAVSEVADEYSGFVTVCKVNVDECPKLADKFNINVIPTLVVIDNGAIVNQKSGYMSKTQIIDLIK